MTTQSRTNVFMIDFAATDNRSARAHLEGRNLRVPLYVAFETAAMMVGRRKFAAADYHKVSQFIYRNLPVIRQKAAAAKHFAIAAVGLVSGWLLGLFYFS